MRQPLKLLKPPSYAAAATCLRHLSACPNPTPSAEPMPFPEHSSSPISETLSLLQTTDPGSWPANPRLQSLLSSLLPSSVLGITRKLPNYQNALQFFNHLKTTSQSDSVPLAFQAVLEHVMRENPDSPRKLYELFLLEKEQNTPLSVNAGTLLIERFSQAKMLDEMIVVFDAIDEEKVNTDVLNLVVAELLKWGRVNDALKLVNEMLEPDSHYPPNYDTASIVFSNILKRNWSGRCVTDEEICNLVSSFGERGFWLSGFLFTEIIMRLCRHGNCDKAWDLLHEAMNSGDVEVAPCNALLTGLAQARDFTRMNLLMKEMKEKGIQTDVVTYGIMIKHLCKFRRLDKALEMFEKMKDGELHVEPNVVIYNTLIDGLCKVGRQQEGLDLMEKMKLERVCDPNTITYNCLINGFCKAGDLDKGRELFEQMSEEGVNVDVITLNRVLDGMCRHGRASSAMEFFSRMQEKGLKGNAVTYTILMTAFCGANNIDKAMKLFNEMRENGCSPDAFVYYSLISALTRAGRMDDASVIVSKLKEAGLSLDILSYNILIGGFCRKNKLDKASELLKDMENAGLKPNRVTYNTMLSFFCASGDFTRVHKWMEKMTDDGLKPNIVTYGALIQAYCADDKLDEAMKIFRDMGSSSKAPPNTVTYNVLIDSLCKNDDVEGALSLMDDMKERGVRPNTTTYNALFKGLHHRNWFEKGIEFMDQMTEQACKPDYITLDILIGWLSAVGEIEKLRKFVQGFQVSASTAYMDG